MEDLIKMQSVNLNNLIACNGVYNPNKNKLTIKVSPAFECNNHIITLANGFTKYGQINTHNNICSKSHAENLLNYYADCMFHYIHYHTEYDQNYISYFYGKRSEYHIWYIVYNATQSQSVDFIKCKFKESEEDTDLDIILNSYDWFPYIKNITLCQSNNLDEDAISYCVLKDSGQYSLVRYNRNPKLFKILY